MRWQIGGIGVGVAVGWNIAILGPIATRLAHDYRVSLTTIGLFVTVQFVVHMLMQVPGGRRRGRPAARRLARLAGFVSQRDRRRRSLRDLARDRPRRRPHGAPRR